MIRPAMPQPGHCLTAMLAPLLLTVLAAPVRGQSADTADVRSEIFAGSELDRYVRVLQLGGVAEPYPIGIRGLSAVEIEGRVDRERAHPWAARYSFADSSDGRLQVGWIRPGITGVLNTTFPEGANDGAVWAGRGLTGSVEGGAWARLGPLSLVLAPTAFWSQNAAFDTAPWRGEDQQFQDPRYPNAIDLPPRFGNGAYWRVDPGQSTLRADVMGVAAGVSTANQVWGPGNDYPIVLSANAPGFEHVFIGTSTPADIWLGTLHGRFVWGRLDQSDYSPVDSGQTRRFMSGLVGTFSPRGVSGLEIGLARFFHTIWPDDGLAVDNFLKPLEGFLKIHVKGDGVEGRSDRDNQIASVFMRWLPPRTGFEIYGEFAREDHNVNMRDFFLEPDHNSAYMLGFSKVWPHGGRWTVLRGELVNAEETHLFRVRDQNPFYVHTFTRQGHTHRGQVLGAPAAYGGAGTTLAIDQYHEWGRWTVAWRRAVRNRRGVYWSTGNVETEAADVVHSIGLEALLFRGPIEVTASATGAWEFNRYFEDDAYNGNFSVGARWIP